MTNLMEETTTSTKEPLVAWGFPPGTARLRGEAVGKPQPDGGVRDLKGSSHVCLCTFLESVSIGTAGQISFGARDRMGKGGGW